MATINTNINSRKKPMTDSEMDAYYKRMAQTQPESNIKPVASKNKISNFDDYKQALSVVNIDNSMSSQDAHKKILSQYDISDPLIKKKIQERSRKQIINVSPKPKKSLEKSVEDYTKTSPVYR